MKPRARGRHEIGQHDAKNTIRGCPAGIDAQSAHEVLVLAKVADLRRDVSLVRDEEEIPVNKDFARHEAPSIVTAGLRRIATTIAAIDAMTNAPQLIAALISAISRAESANASNAAS